MPFDTLWTPDYSPLVVHFTKGTPINRRDLLTEGDPLHAHQQTPAFERLKSIIQNRVIHGAPIPFVPNDPRAVCFTECVWEGLNALADRYSYYGIVFSKRLLFDQGGGPALYVRGDMLQNLGAGLPPDMYPFIAPFDPEAKLKQGVRLDWLQEREWRVPHSLKFADADIQYVLVNSIADASQLVQFIGAQHLPEKKVIPMEVHRQIKQAWTGLT